MVRTTANGQLGWVFLGVGRRPRRADVQPVFALLDQPGPFAARVRLRSRGSSSPRWDVLATADVSEVLMGLASRWAREALLMERDAGREPAGFLFTALKPGCGDMAYGQSFPPVSVESLVAKAASAMASGDLTVAVRSSVLARVGTGPSSYSELMLLSRQLSDALSPLFPSETR